MARHAWIAPQQAVRPTRPPGPWPKCHTCRAQIDMRRFRECDARLYCQSCVRHQCRQRGCFSPRAGCARCRWRSRTGCPAHAPSYERCFCWGAAVGCTAPVTWWLAGLVGRLPPDLVRMVAIAAGDVTKRATKKAADEKWHLNKCSSYSSSSSDPSS